MACEIINNYLRCITTSIIRKVSTVNILTKTKFTSDIALNCIFHQYITPIMSMMIITMVIIIKNAVQKSKPRIIEVEKKIAKNDIKKTIIASLPKLKYCS